MTSKIKYEVLHVVWISSKCKISSVCNSCGTYTHVPNATRMKIHQASYLHSKYLLNFVIHFCLIGFVCRIVGIQSSTGI